MNSLSEVKVLPVCLACTFCSALICGVIALPLAFKSLAQGRYALELNWQTQIIAPDVKVDPGMHYLGFGNMFVEFPSTFQTMYFVRDTRGIDPETEEGDHPSIQKGPLRARSSDGLEMIVSISFQWQLKKESLKPLYDILGGGTLEESLYRDEFVRFARSAIVESCANFAADRFFTNRTTITNDMLQKVKKVFNQPNIGMDMIIQGLQLREVDLPDAYDEEIVRTQEQMQEVEVALAEREEKKIGMQKELMVAEERVRRVVQESLGRAEQIRLENEAVVQQKLIYQQKQADANAEILGKFINDGEPYARLFELMEIHALNAHNDTRLMINL